MSLANLLKKFTRKAEEAVHPIKLFSPHTPLINQADGEEMTYVVSDVYLEIGQGGTSPIRGFGTPIPLAILVLILGSLVKMDYAEILQSFSQHESFFGLALDVFFTIFLIVGCFIVIPMCIFYLWTSFCNVTDATVRLDRKRQKAYLWTGTQGVIEIDWNKLTPRIESHVTSVYATTMVHHGQYVELGADGKVKKTGVIPHQFRCGSVAGGEQGALWRMEFVRRYMEQGPQSLPPVKRFLRHRPKWWAIINFLNIAQDWADWHARRGQPNAPPAPWGFTVFVAIFAPLLFPFQFCNWLALNVAPIPKWPKEIREMHEADLQALDKNPR